MTYNKFYINGLIAVAMTTLASCASDDITSDDGSASDRICFRHAEAERYGETRSDGRQYVLRSSESADTLCMRMETVDGIDTGSADTRGSQVTDTRGLADFDCFAYVDDGGTEKFYIDGEKYRNGGSTYYSDNVYFWPNRDMDFDFYAVAPADAEGLRQPTSPADRSLSYTVPADVAGQADLMFASNSVNHKADEKHAAVPLTFRHLLSAVKIKTGKTMPAGTLQSVTFENVYSSASYDMKSGDWYSRGAAGTYTVTPNTAVTGEEGQEILGGDNTLLMLPQQLGAAGTKSAVRMTVKYYDTVRKKTYTLSADLGGEWLMGQTHTYVLSITPEYELYFATHNTHHADAHYSIIPISVTSGGLYRDGGWTLEIVEGPASATLKADALTPYEKSGYWLEDDDNYKAYCKSVGVNGLRSRKVTGVNSAETVYLFLEENATDSDIPITLELYPTKYPNVDYAEKKREKWSIMQHHPNWDANGIGWEDIEEEVGEAKEFPYGFLWDRKVTLRSKDKMNALSAWLIKMQVRTGGGLDIITDAEYPDFVTSITAPRVFRNDYLTFVLDYSKVNNVTGAGSAADGLANTYALYTFSGANTISIEEWLLNQGFVITSQSGSTANVSDYAAGICLRKNKFTLERLENGSTYSYSIKQLSADEIKWYLPATSQFSTVRSLNFGEGCTPMDGDYWTSTALNDNVSAYAWNGSAYSSPRMTSRRIRAVRRR